MYVLYTETVPIAPFPITSWDFITPWDQPLEHQVWIVLTLYPPELPNVICAVMVDDFLVPACIVHENVP